MTGPSPPVRVQILDRDATGPVVTFRLPVVRIGRDSSCEVCFDDPSISRVHCAIHRQGDRAILVVGQSRNPTFVNGVKASNAELRPDDVLSVCDHRIRFEPTAGLAAGQGPNTLDHLDSRRKDRAAESDGTLKAVLVDDSDDDDGVELDLDLGRPDEEHTRVMPRSAVRPPEEKTRVMPRGGKAEVVAKRAPGRGDGEHTRVLPRGAPKKPKAKNQAMILSSGGQAPADDADEPDAEKLYVAIQGMEEHGEGGPGRTKPASRPLWRRNSFRFGMLGILLLLTILAWKDTLFGSADKTPTISRPVAGALPDLVVDRDGRSDAELVAAAKKAFDVGCKKLEEHHLQDENLTVAIRKLSEAKQTLELLAQPPSLMNEVDKKLAEAEDLREEKYRDALFRYQKLRRAGNLRDGQTELEFILRLIADEEDPRYQAAARDLVAIGEARQGGRR